MSDRYIDFANSSLGHRLVAALGLPSPVRLERWQAGRLRPVEGALLLGGGALASNVQAFANRLTDAIYTYGAEASTWIPGHGPKLKAVVFDASDLQHTDQLKQLREYTLNWLYELGLEPAPDKLPLDTRGIPKDILRRLTKSA